MIGRIRRTIPFVLVGSVLVGCATQGSNDQGAVRVSNDLQFYELYDNSRDWGPSFLVGPPNRHQGEGSRINDFRSAPPSDVSGSPPSMTPPSIPDQPLPPVP